MPNPVIKGSLVALIAAMLAACSGVDIEPAEPYVTEQNDKIRQRSGTVHGNPKGIVIYSEKDGEAEGVLAPGDRTAAAEASLDGAGAAAVETGPGITPFLWQATLESLDFMPLSQADSRGGVVITDWYAPVETPDERFKITVYIRDQDIRPDAVKVSVFRQTAGDRGWTDAAVDEKTARGLEDNILTRARELRLVTTGDAGRS